MSQIHTHQLKLGVLAPDLPSGKAFGKVLHQAGMKADVHHFRIAPRVLGNQINPDPQVTLDLQAAFDAMEKMGYRQIAIACNTLQLWLPKIKTTARVYSTFDAVKNHFPQGEKLLWLGTTPLVSAMQGEFETLISHGAHQLQDLVQEIIWRTKAVTGADYDRSAGFELADSREVLASQVNKLIRFFKAHRVSGVVLGCTELPIAFSYATADNHGLALHDPAEYLAKMIVQS